MQRWGWAVIAVAVLLVYWPLSSFGWSVSQHDTLNCWLPWRWAMASFLHDGHLPAWNPYQQFGYPQYADLQGPAWYVEALATSGTIGQGVHVLQALFLLYVIIGGVGVLRLVRTIHGDAGAALVMGTAYALGGFFTGHQMHLYAVISAAWLPWAFDAVLRLLRAPGARVALEAGVLHYLLLSGGNHTFTIIAAYVELLLGAVFLYRAWSTGRWSAVLRLMRMALLFLATTVVLACGTLYAVQEVLPLMSRGGGLDLERAADGPFTLAALRSLFFPYLLGTDVEQLGTHTTMANGFMGVLVLGLAVLAFWRRRRPEEHVLLAVGVVAALAAFGSALPVHGWLWRHVPGMDLFRFPAYFRWFTWLALVVLAGGSLQAWWSGALDRRKVSFVWWGLAVVGILVAWSMPSYEALSEHAPATLYERMTQASSAERMGWALPVPLLVLLLTGIAAWRGRAGRWMMLVCVVAEMGWSTTLVQWDTAVSPVAPAIYHDRLAQLAEGPKFPVLDPMDRHVDNDRALQYLMYNVHDYLQRSSRSGYNSFWLANAAELQLEHDALWRAMGRQPLVYLSDRVVDDVDYTTGAGDPSRDPSLVVLPPGAHVPKDLAVDPADRITVSGFEHDAIALQVHTRAAAMLVLQQSHYPGWQVSIDGSPAELLNVNIAAMGALVPGGAHTVEFTFHKPWNAYLLALSLSVFLGVLAFLAWTSPERWSALGGVGLLALALGWSLFAHRPKSERLPLGLAHAVQGIPEQARAVLHTDRAQVLDVPPGTIVLRAEEAQDVALVQDLVPWDRPIRWIEGGLRVHSAVRALVKDRMRVVERTEVHGVEAVSLVPAEAPLAGRSWDPGAAGGRYVLHPEAPYAPAVELALDSLERGRGQQLVFDLEAHASKATEASLVIERHRGGRRTDYRQCPLAVPALADTAAWVPAYAVVPVNEVHRPGETLRIYIWQPEKDTIAVRNLRIRVVEEPLDRW